MIIEYQKTNPNSDLSYLLHKTSLIKQILQNYVDGKPVSTYYDELDDPENTVALQQLVKNFDLSSFEEFVLVLCAGVELDSDIARLCAVAQKNPASTYPTFGLALNMFSSPSWNSLTPVSPLRKFNLIHLYEPSTSTPITTNPLFINEKILHYLAGSYYMDAQLNNLLTDLTCHLDVPASHLNTLKKTENIMNKTKNSVILLYGNDRVGKLSISKKICVTSNIIIKKIESDLIPSKPEDLETFSQLWNRESLLTKCCLFIQHDEEPDSLIKIKKILSRLSGHIIIDTIQREELEQPVYALPVDKPTKEEQQQLWEHKLGKLSKTTTNMIHNLVTQFDLSFSTINNVIEETRLLTRDSNFEQSIWHSTCKLATNKISNLAQEIPTTSNFDDLILPEKQKQILEYALLHVKHRYTVHERKQYNHSSKRGLGISLLFYGESGTGKTFCAEVLAHRLNLLLFKVDTASLVSKWYGETEKNIKKIFDACDDGGAILFFDEADALFGKRSEVKTSQDKNANSEVDYLLQKMDSYKGIIILSTNMKNAIDEAFIAGRIKYSVEFPFPDAVHRKLIWQKTFPPNVNTSKINFERLSKINLNGRLIRNAAILADVLATEEGKNITMDHLIEAIKIEYAKAGRTVRAKDMIT